jgi:hypothetical protein
MKAMFELPTKKSHSTYVYSTNPWNCLFQSMQSVQIFNFLPIPAQFLSHNISLVSLSDKIYDSYMTYKFSSSNL